MTPATPPWIFTASSAAMRLISRPTDREARLARKGPGKEAKLSTRFRNYGDVSEMPA